MWLTNSRMRRPDASVLMRLAHSWTPIATNYRLPNNKNRDRFGEDTPSTASGKKMASGLRLKLSGIHKILRILRIYCTYSLPAVTLSILLQALKIKELVEVHQTFSSQKYTHAEWHIFSCSCSWSCHVYVLPLGTFLGEKKQKTLFIPCNKSRKPTHTEKTIKVTYPLAVTRIPRDFILHVERKTAHNSVQEQGQTCTIKRTKSWNVANTNLCILWTSIELININISSFRAAEIFKSSGHITHFLRWVHAIKHDLTLCGNSDPWPQCSKILVPPSITFVLGLKHHFHLT